MRALSPSTARRPGHRAASLVMLAACLLLCLGVGECLDGDVLAFREARAREAAEEAEAVRPSVAVEECTELPAAMPLALDRVPGPPALPNTLLVGNPTPPALVPVDISRDPPALRVAAVQLPADSNGDGVADATTPVLDGVVGVSSSLALVTTTVNEQVVFADPTDGTLVSGLVAGAPRTAVSTAVLLTPEAGAVDSDGAAVVAPFVAGGTSGAAIDTAGTRLFVSMSNLGEDFATEADPTYGPGAVLVFDLDLTTGVPVIADASPQVIFTRHTNPTDVVAYAEPGGRSFVLVTTAGAVARVQGTVGLQPIANFDLAAGARAGNATALQSAIEVIEIPAVGDPFLAGEIPLGPTAAGFGRVQVDPSGSVGAVGSLLGREVLAVDLRTLPLLGTTPLDPPPVLDGSTGPDATIASASLTLTPLATGPDPAVCQGSIVGTAWTSDGRLLASEFCDGTLSSWDFDLTTAPIPVPAARIGLRTEFPATAPLVLAGLGELQAPTAVVVRNPPPPANLPDVYLLVGLPEGRLCGIDSDVAL